MPRRSPILEALAEAYAKSSLGQTGRAARDFSLRLLPLLKAAGCERGDAYANAMADLEAEQGHALKLDRDRRSHDVRRVIVPLEYEAALFARVGRTSPTRERAAWAALFEATANADVPEEYRAAWAGFCQRRQQAALSGGAGAPFRKGSLQRARVQLEVLARLLGWKGEALLRTVSIRLSGSSKFLEHCRATMEALLAEASGGTARAFADLGIADTPRSVTFHGPVRIKLDGRWIDYAAHASGTLSDEDIARGELECTAPRCVTVENATTFHQLCGLRCGDLFVLTSYPNRATVEFLRRLPSSLPRFHFGDTDPWGFDVLRSLRTTLREPIEPLHMAYRPNAAAPSLTDRDRRKLTRLIADDRLADVRPELERMAAAGTKGDFEQESLLISGPFPYL